MCTIRFISDLHFGHKGLNDALRHFPTIEEHDNHIIKCWNSVVGKRDITYVLGDITMDSIDNLYKLNLLNGEIRIIGGNHDTRRICKELTKLRYEVLGCLQYKGYMVTHCPIHPRELEFYRGNIHGHVHGEHLGTGYYNVSCECVDYTPKTLDELIVSNKNEE